MDFKAQKKRYRSIEELYPDVRLLTKKFTTDISYAPIQPVFLLHLPKARIR